jgi:hypothetical protein
MSLLNIVIHMLFASIGLLSVEREVEDKISIWYQQEKSFNEYRNKFHVLRAVLDVHCDHAVWSPSPQKYDPQRFWSAGGIMVTFFASCRTA